METGHYVQAKFVYAEIQYAPCVRCEWLWIAWRKMG